MTKKEKNEMLLEGCKEGDYDKVRLALNFGADVRAKDVYGNTPLHSVLGKNGSCQHFRALSNGRMKIIKLLLKAGAGVKAKDNGGKTPLYLAQPHEIQDLFKKYIKKHLQM
jgi:ankyrin repeat protein